MTRTISILHVVGARPQFMKLYPLYTEMKKKGINQKILHTGQHFDDMMSNIFFEEMNIPKPNYNLNIHSLPHGAMTGKMIEEIEKIILNEDFNYVIVYGDTNSTVAGAIAAKKLKIKVVHIESGVRNFDNNMPEEINRVITDRISDLLFCSTEKSLNNLKKEGYLDFDCEITNVGDLMYDCMLLFKDKINNHTDQSQHILVTCHRESNTNEENLINIVNALNQINETYPVVFSVHPRTKKIIKKLKINIKFKCIEPSGYLNFLELISQSKYIISDSGGVIREAYFFKIPSLVLLEKPLWPELVENKVCYNCPPKEKLIIETFNLINNKTFNFQKNIFGDGNARELISNKILDYDRRLH